MVADQDDSAVDELPDETGPERTCIVTRAKRGKSDLIRFVLGPDRALVPDIRAKLPGRGAWVLADAGSVALAVKRKAFARVFKGPVTSPEDLSGFVGSILEADALQALAFANKAGLVTCGTTKVEAAVGGKSVIGLVHATEAGEDGIRKLQGALRRRFGEDAESICRVQIFASSQLDLALGRTHVIHAALAAGAASEGFIARSKRLERYRGSMPLSVVGQTQPFDDRHNQGEAGI